MIDYKVCLNNGIEAFDVDQKTITANEDVKTADEQALAREIHHENSLIPEQLAKAVLENFCKAAANLMSMGFAIQLKNDDDVALRIHPDIHVKGGNINLARAQELDPKVTELTLENAGDLVSKAGVTLRVKAECQPKFTELLKSLNPSVNRAAVIERAKVALLDGDNGGEEPGDDNGANEGGGGGTTPGGGGSEEEGN